MIKASVIFGKISFLCISAVQSGSSGQLCCYIVPKTKSLILIITFTEKAPLVGFDLDRIREDKLDWGRAIAGRILSSLLQQAVVVEENLKKG